MNWIEICRKHITDQICALSQGRFDLHTPTLSGHIQYTSGVHYHTTPEMSSQISGKRTAYFPAQRFKINPSDICVIPAMLPHFGSKIKNTPSLFMVITFEHSDLSFVKGEGNPGKIPHATEVLTIKTKKEEDIKYYLNHICNISQIKHNASESVLHGILLACFSELMIILDEYKASKNNTLHPKVFKVQRLVVANLQDNRLNVNFISKLVSCSPEYLSHLFRAETGIRLSAYINKKRLEHSRQLLELTSMNISEIAYSCGYSDPGYFTRIFRKETGVVPHKYRRL